MTRKDYERLARAFAVSRPVRMSHETFGEHADKFAAWVTVRGAVMVELEADNGRFDRRKFYAATEA